MAYIRVYSDEEGVHERELDTDSVDFKSDSANRSSGYTTPEDFQQEVWEAILEVVFTETNKRRKPGEETTNA